MHDTLILGTVSIVVNTAMTITITISVIAVVFGIVINGFIYRNLDRIGFVHRYRNVFFDSDGHWFLYRYGNMFFHGIRHLLLNWHSNGFCDLKWHWLGDRNCHRVRLRYSNRYWVWHIDFYWMRYWYSYENRKRNFVIPVRKSYIGI